MNSQDATQTLRDLILKYASSTVIVEGPKDRAALRAFGYTDIILYSEPAYAIAESLESRDVTDVLILTDLDKAGKKKYSELKRALTRHGIRVNDELRHYLFKHTELSHVEGLHTYLSNH